MLPTGPFLSAGLCTVSFLMSSQIRSKCLASKVRLQVICDRSVCHLQCLPSNVKVSAPAQDLGLLSLCVARSYFALPNSSHGASGNCKKTDTSAIHSCGLEVQPAALKSCCHVQTVNVEPALHSRSIKRIWVP